MPKTARERIANPRAGTALAPQSGMPRECVPRMSKVIVFVTLSVTNVKGIVSVYVTPVAGTKVSPVTCTQLVGRVRSPAEFVIDASADQIFVE